ARVAIEHQDPKAWQDRALAEKDTGRALEALLGLVRVRASDPFHRTAKSPVPDEELKKRIFTALDRLGWGGLGDDQRMDLLRIYEVAMNRMGPPPADLKKKLTARLDSAFPGPNRDLNAELCQVLVYLEAASIVTKALKRMAEAPTQEEQLEYA